MVIRGTAILGFAVLASVFSPGVATWQLCISSGNLSQDVNLQTSHQRGCLSAGQGSIFTIRDFQELELQTESRTYKYAASD